MIDKLMLQYSLLERDAENIKQIETFSNTLYDTIKEAISNKISYALLSDLEKIEDAYERVAKALEIENTINKQRFYFGYISALTSLALDIGQAENEKNKYRDLIRSYKLLLPVLATIAKYDTVSGIRLKQETGQKNSGLSNFVRRIEPYGLIEVDKLGTVNYYSLTRKGKKLLEQSRKDCAETTENENELENSLLYALEELKNQMEKEKPSAIPVLRQLSSSCSNKRMLKLRIESVFLSRDYFVRKKMMTMAKLLYDKRGELEESNAAWNGNYSDKEYETVVLEDISYV